jgi:hypothetical protein
MNKGAWPYARRAGQIGCELRSTEHEDWKETEIHSQNDGKILRISCVVQPAWRHKTPCSLWNTAAVVLYKRLDCWPLGRRVFLVSVQQLSQGACEVITLVIVWAVTLCVGWVLTEVSKDPNAFVQQAKLPWPWRWRHYSTPKLQQPQVVIFSRPFQSI